MLQKNTASGLLLAAIVIAAWSYKNTETIRNWLHPKQAPMREIKFDNDMPASKTFASGELDAAPTRRTAPGALRKCRMGSKTLYTNDICPEGSVEQGLKRGAITVLKTQNAGDSPSAKPAVIPNVRDALIGPDQQGLQEKRMEQIINR